MIVILLYRDYRCISELIDEVDPADLTQQTVVLRHVRQEVRQGDVARVGVPMCIYYIRLHFVFEVIFKVQLDSMQFDEVDVVPLFDDLDRPLEVHLVLVKPLLLTGV